MLVLKCRRNGGDLLAFGPDSRMLASRGETGLQFWSDFDAKPVLFREVRGTASIRFTPDGRSLVFDGAVDGVIDLRSNTLTRHPDTDDYRYSTLSFDGRHILSVNLPADRTKNTIACWPVKQPFVGKPIWRVPLKQESAGRPIPLADGRFLLDEGDRGYHAPESRYRYSIRSGETGRLLATIKKRSWFTERETASLDGRWLACQHTNKLRIWSLADPKRLPIDRVQEGSKKIFTDLAFHPSGRWLAVTSTDETVKFFDTATWTVSRIYSWKLGKMVGVAFSPDGLLCAAGSERGRILIWDVDD